MKAAHAALCALALCFSLSALADHPQDPYEKYNRAVFKFNDKADRYVLSPAARAYRAVTPKPARSAVSNFFNNLRDIGSIGSNLLRGNVRKAGYDFMRVAVNSTFGLGGLINIADAAGMPNNKNTLGDTFASWGWKRSNYFVVPLLGPSTVRDSVGGAIAIAYSPERLLIPAAGIRYGAAGLNVVSQREQLLDLTDTLDQVALDKYAYTRDVYLALRAKQTGNTDPATADGELSDPALSASPDAGAGDDLTDPELENGADTGNGSAKQPENAATAASETASPATDANADSRQPENAGGAAESSASAPAAE